MATVALPPDDELPPLPGELPPDRHMNGHDIEAIPPRELMAPTGERPNWPEVLKGNKQGFYNNLDNVIRVIETDPDLKGKIWYDEFLDAIVTTWQAKPSNTSRKWRDADDVLLQLYMQRFIGLSKVMGGTCHDAALVAAFRNIRNECKEWLKSLRWDETPRLGNLLSDAFGTPQSAYTEAVGRCFIVSMVARVMRPGCKVDTVPVFEGSQGVGKSTAINILGGKWATECHESVLNKDFYGILDGHMLVEISEMHSFSRHEVERIKGVISNPSDRYRRAYGRNTEDHPRQTVLACTTNRDDWQRDETGARRFWPVLCGEINLDYLRENRDQLFAEAVYLFESGASWWDVPVGEQQAEVEKRREVDSWESSIETWLIGRAHVTTSQILFDCIRIELEKHDIALQKRVGRCLRVLGWHPGTIRDGSKVSRGWVKS